MRAPKIMGYLTRFFIGMMLKKQLVIVLVCILAGKYFLNQAMTFNPIHKTS